MALFDKTKLLQGSAGAKNQMGAQKFSMGSANQSPQERLRAAAQSRMTSAKSVADRLPNAATRFQAVQNAEPASNRDQIQEAIRNLLQQDPNRADARAATQASLDARNAQALQMVQAQQNLAGSALTGAAGNIVGQNARENARNNVLTMDQFDRDTQQEALRRLIAAEQLDRQNTEHGWASETYQDNKWLEEEEANRDLDGDGWIGKPDGDKNAYTEIDNLTRQDIHKAIDAQFRAARDASGINQLDWLNSLPLVPDNKNGLQVVTTRTGKVWYDPETDTLYKDE